MPRNALRADPEVLHIVRLDDMTGLYNREYFLERVHEDRLRSRRYGWPLCVLLLSLDRFDAFRAEHGSLSSDNMLASIASMLRKSARDTDLAARFDDATFALLLPGTWAAGAEVIARRMRDRVSGHLLASEQGDVLQVTCSQGIAEYVPEEKEVDDLVGNARRSLRLAQESGGDCYRVYRSE